MKIFILFLTLTILLSGCSILNLADFVLPDDINFINTIKELDTPEKICSYMKENFTYKKNLFYNPDPYTLWQTKKGDCNDFSTFATFVANYHGYETYQIKIYYQNSVFNHFLAIYKENGLYNFSTNRSYYPVNYDNFSDIVKFNSEQVYNAYGYLWSSYIVYDYNMNIVEKVQK